MEPKFNERDWRKNCKTAEISGPWDSEPDREEWRHKGLPCLINRGPLGAWCGYVAVPPGHPSYLKHYDKVDVEVHGGLTYSHTCAREICHVPQQGEAHNVWWLGFDCGHAGDLVPGMDAIRGLMGKWHPSPGLWAPSNPDWEGYRDATYVKAEVERLADQLAAMKLRSLPTAFAYGVAGRVWAQVEHRYWYHRLQRTLWRLRVGRITQKLRRQTATKAQTKESQG